MTETKQQLKGAAFIAAAALLFSIGGLVIKLLPWSPLSINGGRNILAAAVTALYMKSTRQKFVFNWSVLLGAVAFGATTTLFVWATKLTTAANAILLQFTSTIFIMLFLWIFWKQRPRKIDVIGSAVILFGVAFFFLDSLSTGGMLGNILAVASGLTYSVVYLVKLIPNSNASSSFLLGQLITGTIGIPFICTETDFSGSILLGILILGLFQQGVAFIFFTKGILMTPPVAASLVGTVEPILNPILVAIFYGEVLGPTAIVGAVIVIGGICSYSILSQRLATRGNKERAAARMKRD